MISLQHEPLSDKIMAEFSCAHEDVICLVLHHAPLVTLRRQQFLRPECQLSRLTVNKLIKNHASRNAACIHYKVKQLLPIQHCQHPRSLHQLFYLHECLLILVVLIPDAHNHHASLCQIKQKCNHSSKVQEMARCPIRHPTERLYCLQCPRTRKINHSLDVRRIKPDSCT